jgi:hypothetical protein
VAYDTTCGRALGEIGQVPRDRIAAARAAAREHMWKHLPDGLPALMLVGGSYSMGTQVVLRVDASIVESHSRRGGRVQGRFRAPALVPRPGKLRGRPASGAE